MNIVGIDMNIFKYYFAVISPLMLIFKYDCRREKKFTSINSWVVGTNIGKTSSILMS